MLVTDWPGANRFLPPRRGMPIQFSNSRMPDNNTGNIIVPFTMLPGYMEDEERYETRRVFDQLNRDAKEDRLLELLRQRLAAAPPAAAPAPALAPAPGGGHAPPAPHGGGPAPPAGPEAPAPDGADPGEFAPPPPPPSPPPLPPAGDVSANPKDIQARIIHELMALKERKLKPTATRESKPDLGTEVTRIQVQLPVTEGQKRAKQLSDELANQLGLMKGYKDRLQWARSKGYKNFGDVKDVQTPMLALRQYQDAKSSWAGYRDVLAEYARKEHHFDIKTGQYLEANEHKSEGFYASTYINNTARHHPHGRMRPCLPVHWSS